MGIIPSFRGISLKFYLSQICFLENTPKINMQKMKWLCTKVFVVALFLITKDWKEHNLNNLFRYTVECYVIVKNGSNQDIHMIMRSDLKESQRKQGIALIFCKKGK
jgi:hypothetical protein